MKNGDLMRLIRFFVSVLICLSATSAFSRNASSPIDLLQAERQRIGKDAQINLQQFSHDTQAIVARANVLNQSGENQKALEKLLELNKYASLDRYPDYTVQVVCFNVYTGLANERDATACRRRAAAMAVILLKLSGGGNTPDDPVRIVRVGEIGDWLRLRSAKMTDVQAIQYQGSSLQKVTFTTPADSHVEVAYFLMNPREVFEIDQTARDIFQPLPVSDTDGKYAAAMKEAHERRAKFLSDQSFNYRELVQLVQDSQKEAMQLAQQGDVEAALSKIREVERIRPIRDIPIFSLVSNYSALLGKAGDEGAHADMRLYLFGITQDIAHSGDGLTPETAIRVIAVNEEYSWLSAKKLHATRQALIRNGDSQYDAIEATDASGRSRTYYFDVTPFFGRYLPVANKQ